jgi:hypothetical protein
MNLLADESVDAPIVGRLRLDGHEVAYVTDAFTVISAGMVRIRHQP